MTIPARGEVIDGGRTVVWTPHPPPYVFQRRFLSCGAFEALGGGAAGPGKTDCLVAKSALAALAHSRGRVLFLRTVGTDLHEVEDRMQRLYPSLGGTWAAQDRMWTFPSGGTVRLGYGKTLAEVGRYLGHEYTGIAFDELGLLPFESVWLELIARVRSPIVEGEVGPELWAWGTANPGGPGHGWLKARFVVPCGRRGERVVTQTEEINGVRYTLRRAYVPGTLKDNPSLSPEYLVKLRQMSERRRRQLEDGDWDTGEGLFFPREGFRVVPPLATLPPWWRYWGSYDWGFRHPAAGFGFGQDGDGTVHVLGSWHRRRLSDAEQAASFRGTIPSQCHRNVLAGADAFFKRKAHEEAPETVADVFQRHGVLLVEAVTDREAGWRSVLRLMTPTRDLAGRDVAPSRLVWWDTPPNRATIERVEPLSADPDNADDLLKVDADAETGAGGDDSADAMRYGLAAMGARKPKGEPPPLLHRHEFRPGEDEVRDPLELTGVKRPALVRFRPTAHPALERTGDTDQFPEEW